MKEMHFSNEQPKFNSLQNIQAIRGRRISPKTGFIQYLIKWKNTTQDNNNWVPSFSLFLVKPLIDKFEQEFNKNNCQKSQGLEKIQKISKNSKRSEQQNKVSLKQKNHREGQLKLHDFFVSKTQAINSSINPQKQQNTNNSKYKIKIIKNSERNTSSLLPQNQTLISKINPTPNNQPKFIHGQKQTNINHITTSKIEIQFQNPKLLTNNSVKQVVHSKYQRVISTKPKSLIKVIRREIPRDRCKKLRNGQFRIVDVIHKNNTFYYKLSHQSQNLIIWEPRDILLRYCPQLLTQFFIDSIQ